VSEKEPPLVVPDESLLQENEERDQRKIVHNSMKSLLSSTNDGWLVAAPLGNARTQCRKRMEEIADFDVTYPSDAVDTLLHRYINDNYADQGNGERIDRACCFFMRIVSKRNPCCSVWVIG
jgi:hypothetical protein